VVTKADVGNVLEISVVDANGRVEVVELAKLVPIDNVSITASNTAL
jgi:hypothetical protein